MTTIVILIVLLLVSNVAWWFAWTLRGDKLRYEAEQSRKQYAYLSRDLKYRCAVLEAMRRDIGDVRADRAFDAVEYPPDREAA